jgi:hypothetical protein
VWLLFCVLPLIVVGQSTGLGLIDPWWNFALGNLQLEQHQLVFADPFSFTPIAPGVINQQWLAQLAWALAYDLAGPVGAFILRGAAVAVTTISLWCIGRRLGASRRALVAASLLSGYLIAFNLGIRAQTLAFPIAALSLFALQRGGRVQWLCVPLAVVWANVHGSFPLAVAFTAAFTIGSFCSGARRQAFGYAALTLATAIGTLLTPYGPQVWRYAIELSSNDTMRSVLSEWAPTTIQTPTGKAFFLELAAACAIFAVRRPRIPVTWLVMAAGLTLFGLSAVRNVVWLGIVALPLWGLLLDRAFWVFADHPTRPRTLKLMAIVLVAIALMPALPDRIRVPIAAASEVSAVDQEQVLADLVGYLHDNPDGLLFHDADWGAYLEAHLGPAQHVFIDTRFEVHPNQVWGDYFAVVDGRYDWQAILDRYGIKRVAVDPDRTLILARALETTGGWRQVWSSERNAERIVVWQRSEGS